MPTTYQYHLIKRWKVLAFWRFLFYRKEKRYMGSQFYETIMGKRFFEHQLPKLTEALNRIAAAAERKTTPTKTISLSVPSDAHIIAELFEGNFSPEDILVKTRPSTYREQTKPIIELGEEIKAKFGSEAAMMADRYSEMSLSRVSTQITDAFVCGFQTATQLIAAGLIKEGDSSEV